MFLIYGSVAIRHWFHDFQRIPNDIDVVTDVKTKNDAIYEFYDEPEFYEIIKKHHLRESKYSCSEYLSPDSLYTIKCSHIEWDINWSKHIMDIDFLIQKGCKLNKPMYKELREFWEKIHGKKSVNFDKSNEELFKDSVYRKHEHDELHDLFKFYDEPMFKKIKKDLSRAACDEEMFFVLSHSDRIKVCLEELYVTATERYIIRNKVPPMIAKNKALKQLITSMTSGWFCLFLIENCNELMRNCKSEDKEWILKLQENCLV